MKFGSSGEYKVHPDTDMNSPDRRQNRNMTRYQGGATASASGIMDMSASNSALSNSQSKLIRSQITDDGFGRNGSKLISPFGPTGNNGIIKQ